MKYITIRQLLEKGIPLDIEDHKYGDRKDRLPMLLIDYYGEVRYIHFSAGVSLGLGNLLKESLIPLSEINRSIDTIGVKYTKKLIFDHIFEHLTIKDQNKSEDARKQYEAPKRGLIHLKTKQEVDEYLNHSDKYKIMRLEDGYGVFDTKTGDPVACIVEIDINEQEKICCANHKDKGSVMNLTQHMP